MRNNLSADSNRMKFGDLPRNSDYPSVNLKPDERVVATTLPGQTNFPVSLSNPDLGKAINDNLETLRNSGELARIVEKWGFSPSSVDKTEPNLL